MPHRRKVIKSKKGNKENIRVGNKAKNLFHIVILTLAFLIVFFFIIIYKSKNQSEIKFLNNILVVNNVAGDSFVITSLNKTKKSLIHYVFPGDVVVAVSNDLGKYKLKNLYELDRSQKYEGKILVASLQKNFAAPVFLWTEANLPQFGVDNPIEILKFLSGKNNSNIVFFDRLIISYMAVSNQFKNNTIDVTDTSFLKEEIIRDELLYGITGDMPYDITVNWVNPYVTENHVRFKIVNNSDARLLPDSIYKLFEVTGAKIANIEKANSQSEKVVLCKISSKDEIIKSYYNNLFNCQNSEDQSEEIFDFSITINQQFIDLYK